MNIFRREFFLTPLLLFFKPKPKPTVSESIDWLLTNCKDARWDIVNRAMKIMEDGFRKKMKENERKVV